jgi:hypothetical protein
MTPEERALEAAWKICSAWDGKITKPVLRKAVEAYLEELAKDEAEFFTTRNNMENLWMTGIGVVLDQSELVWDAAKQEWASADTAMYSAPVIAWESTTIGYIKYVTDERYHAFSDEVKRWYKPYRCSHCSPSPQETTTP